MRDISAQQSGGSYELNPHREGGPIQTLTFVHPEVDPATGVKTLVDGTTNEEVISMLIERISKQNAKLSCTENLVAIQYLEGALAALDLRSRSREEQGVTNTEEQHDLASTIDAIEREHPVSDLDSVFDIEAAIKMTPEEAVAWIHYAEIQRREVPTLDAIPLNKKQNPDGGIHDYATSGSWIDRAKAHLDEALPNGQHERASSALQVLIAGAMGLAEWMEAKGYRRPRGNIAQTYANRNKKQEEAPATGA